MSILDYIRNFAGNDLGRIVSANACDGEVIGLHPRGFCDRVLAAAYANAPSDPDKTDPREFIRLIADLAINDPSFRGQAVLGAGCSIDTDRAEVMLPIGVLEGFASSDDVTRFARLTGQMPDFKNPRWIEMLSGIPSNERYFRLKPGRTLGTSFIWFSSKRSLDRASQAAKRNGVKPDEVANYLRDLLGLVHREPTSPPLYLVVYSFPASVVEKAVHFRPTFVEAGSHRRFAARPRGRGAPRRNDWGKTVDLARLELGGVLAAGLRERICCPINRSMFEDDENIRFRVVGQVTRSNKFTDREFSLALADGRSDDELTKTLGNTL
ncbi:hypothetical protein [Bradyrhizobium sp. HKCCYLS2033]|uniref:hypothetical protein n=1 Tax=unclassified Bradyrhizobium TaxID=2631580 RepID=UPI003EBB3824